MDISNSNKVESRYGEENVYIEVWHPTGASPHEFNRRYWIGVDECEVLVLRLQQEIRKFRNKELDGCK